MVKLKKLETKNGNGFKLLLPLLQYAVFALWDQAGNRYPFRMFWVIGSTLRDPIAKSEELEIVAHITFFLA